jgi:hypothetical protein
MLPSLRTVAPALLLALPMTFGASAASAENTDLKRVEVRGQRPAVPLGRVDVRKVCAQVDQSLQKSLARSWYLEQKSGVMRVDFTLDGEQVRDVNSTGALRAVYGKAVRQAMGSIDCRSDAQTPQQFTLLISFSTEGMGHQQGHWFALLDQ